MKPQLGFNLLGHPKISKDGKYNYDDLMNQSHAIEMICTQIKDVYDPSKLWFRLRGGNGSQRFSNDLFNAPLISNWERLQHTWGFKLIYTINYNDVNDVFFYKSLVEGGLKFDAIEFGNEQYLPKFRKTAKDDETKCVTKRTEKMNPDKYIKFTRQYIDQYFEFKLPMFIQFAPEGKSQSPYYKTWNDAMTKIVNSDKDLHVSLHCYGNDYPYELITKIKKNTPGKVIFVTEYGATDELTHANKLLEALDSYDCMMSHELYNDYGHGDQSVAWINDKGYTVKGATLCKRLFSNK